MALAESPQPPHEPWEFSDRYINTSSHWKIKQKDSTGDKYRNVKEGASDWEIARKAQYDVRLTKVPTEKLNLALKEQYKVDKTPEEVTKDLIALINQFNKLEGPKALNKIDLQETTSFHVRHDDYYSNEESRKIKFYQFMKVKHAPFSLDHLARNEEDKGKMRDRCTVMVSYEFEESKEALDKKLVEHKQTDAFIKEGKKFTPNLKTRVFYLDETQGNEGLMHLYRSDGNWDRMDDQL